MSGDGSDVAVTTVFAEEVGADEAPPNPQALKALVKEADVDRRRSLFCSRYDHCLDLAVQQQWASWTCERCGRFAAGAYPALSAVDEGWMRPSAS